jgi:Flp pilus assembly protein TadD
MSNRHPSHLTPHDANRLAEARAKYFQGQIPSAIRIYEQLLLSYPSHGPVLAELSQIHLKVGRFSEAEPLLQRLHKLPAPQVNDLRVAAQGFRRIGRINEAIVALKALLRSRIPPELRYSATIDLAELAERINDLDLTEIAVTSLLDQNPHTFESQLLAGKLALRHGQTESALEHFSKARRGPALSDVQQRQIHYANGKALDRAGRFADAYASFVAAKTIELPQSKNERIKATWMADLIMRVTKECRALVAMMTAERFATRQSRFGRPLCFLTGHPRSGTTLLEQMLSAHPSVATADENAAMFQCLVSRLVFPSDSISVGADLLALPSLNLDDLKVTQRKQQEIDEAVGMYRQRLEWIASDTNPKNYLIDKSPAGLIDLPMIESILPDTKVIVVLRDPRDVCLSCFQEDFGVNAVSVNFDSLEAIARKLVRDFAFWFEFRKRTTLAWLEVRYETLISEQVDELRRICSFLELDWCPQMTNFHELARFRPINSPSYLHVVEPVSNRSIGRWKNYRTRFESVQPILQNLIETLGYNDI